MNTVDTSQSSELATLLQAGVEAAAATMVSGGRLAGPASSQDDLSEIVPSPDAVGAYAAFGDGTVALVLLVPTAAEAIAPGLDGALLAAGLSPTLDAAARAMGRNPTTAQAISNAAELPAILGGSDVIIAAGIFDGSDVAATVVAASGSPAATMAGGASATGGQQSQPALSTANLSAQVERGLQILADVNLEVTAELGRTNVSVSSLLDLEPGAVVQLDNAAGSPVDLFVNGTLFARAEVVVVNGSYAVRIAHLVGETDNT